jgi:hypothetical protein
MKMDGTIDKADIELVFPEWVYKQWYTSPDFYDNLNEFNDRKEILKGTTLDQFIKQIYPQVYDRFYLNILSKQSVQTNLISLLTELHPDLDLSALGHLDSSNYIEQITRVLSELLRQYHYPIKL